MKKLKTGMEAVIAKTSGVGRPRKPLMQRKGAGKGKGPGMAIMIAIGKPKPEMGGDSMREELDASKGDGMSKAKKIAALEEKIGYLKAELALLKGDDDEMAMDEESEDEYEADDESEDED